MDQSDTDMRSPTLGGECSGVKDARGRRERGTMGSRAWGGILGVVALGIMTVLGWTATSPPPPASTTEPSDDIVANVGPSVVLRSEFDRRWDLAQGEYLQRTGSRIAPEYLPAAQRQVLELLLRQRLLVLEARRLGITGTPAEAEQMLRQDARFQQDGRFDAARFESLRTQQPATYQRMLENVLGTIGARKLSAQMDRECRPTDDEVRGSDTRRLSLASIDFLPLYQNSFDGSYPEPTEAEVLAEYRKHAGERMLPEEFLVAVVHVDQPPLPDSLVVRVDQREAWTRRMRQRADSLLGAARAGAPLERLATPFGGVERVTVRRGESMPRWWRGTSNELADLFRLTPGRLVSKSIAAEPGWAVMRLETRLPARPAPLTGMAVPIRERLRRDARAYRDDRAIDALFHAGAGELRGPANRVLYAVADTSAFPVPQPTLEQMQAFYEEHVTDYSGLADGADEGSGEVRTRPFAEVRFDVYRRMVNEGRSDAMKSAVRRVANAWRAGRRDPGAERAMSRMVDAGIVPHGGRVDTSLAGMTISDSLAARGAEPGVYTFVFRRGLTVVQVGPVIADHDPSLEQVRAILERRLTDARQRELEQGGRDYFRQHPESFRQQKASYMARMIIPLPSLLDVPVTRREVEQRYQQRIQAYSSEEQVQVRQILIVPRDASAEAEAEARARADSLMTRVRAGEDFAALARAHSEDAASRDNGGDVGRFAHGQMLNEFERAAFRLRPGDIAGPVRTEVGFHLIKCIAHIDAEVTPLKYCYTNVAWDIATARADEVAHARADSVRRLIHSPSEARALGLQHGFQVLEEMHVKGDRVLKELSGFMLELESLSGGQMVEGVQLYRGLGYAVGWVDSVVEDRMPPYNDARSRAEELWQRSASERAMQAKRAELDSMARAGWDLDSLATLFGGFASQEMSGPGKPIKNLGSAWITDSLVFGSPTRPPGLEVGQETGWLRFGGGLARLRLAAKVPPEPYQLVSRAAETRSGLTEGRLRVRYAGIARRFPIRIRDVGMARTSLPAVPVP